MFDESSPRGVYAVNISMAAFVVGDVVLKLLGRSFPPTELIFFRSIIIVVALGALLLWTRPRSFSRAMLSGPVVARCAFDCVNILCFTAAVLHMKLAVLYAILMISPFLTTVLAVIFFREPVGRRRWMAIVVGFCGVLFIIKPEPGSIDFWALIGVISAFAGAGRETVTRKIAPSIPTLEVTLVSALFTAAGTFAFGWREAWPALNRHEALLLSVQAVSWLIGSFLLVYACRLSPLSLVGLFRYMLLVWGALAGYFVFGDVPDLWAIFGAVIVVACGIYIVHREAVRQNAIVSNVAPAAGTPTA